jgi:hypothetical protein
MKDLMVLSADMAHPGQRCCAGNVGAGSLHAQPLSPVVKVTAASAGKHSGMNPLRGDAVLFYAPGEIAPARERAGYW